MEIPAMYRKRERVSTVGDIIWAAQQEALELTQKCLDASNKSTFGWEPKAQAYRKTAEELAAIYGMRLAELDGRMPPKAQHMVVSLEVWEPYKRTTTSMRIRALNIALALRAASMVLLLARGHDLQRADLDQAANELEAITFPDMSGHQWRQPRADEGRRPDPTRAI